jgi:hypothetical protein
LDIQGCQQISRESLKNTRTEGDGEISLSDVADICRCSPATEGAARDGGA